MSRSTYGERMSAWEHEQDERFWVRRFNDAVDNQDYDKVEKLIQEAISDEYEIPSVSDPEVIKLLRKYKL